MLRMDYKKDIEVDGHMNPVTIKLCKKAGANLFAVGSYINRNKDLKKAVNEINKSL